MNIKRLLIIIFTIVGLLLFSTAVSRSYAESASATPSMTMLAYTCAGCHGVNGSSVGPATPTIAGISEDYFIETMEAYKTGERPSTIMTRIAKGYSEKEIELMAKYFSRQSFVRLKQKFNAKEAKL